MQLLLVALLLLSAGQAPAEARQALALSSSAAPRLAEAPARSSGGAGSAASADGWADGPTAAAASAVRPPPDAASPAGSRLLLESAEAQASLPAPTPAAEASGGAGGSMTAGGTAQECLQMQTKFGAACQVGIDRVALRFPRGSTQLPTDQQVQDALAALQQGDLPTPQCCAALADALQARCGCDPEFQALRATIQQQFPVLTPAYLQGTNYIFATACGLDPTCA